MSEISRPFPVWRALLAILLSTALGLLLMPMVTLAPRLIDFAGPIGPFFALVIAPLAALLFGAIIAPYTVALTLLCQAIAICGLHALRQTSAWVWALAGLASGALCGTALGREIDLLGFTLPATIVSGALTGIVCALLARMIMTFQR